VYEDDDSEDYDDSKEILEQDDDDGEKDADELFILHMIYQSNLIERPITNVIGMIRQNITTPPNIKLILKGFVKEYMDEPKFMIDAYYLSLC
jgi:hypothetical protein